MNNRILTINLVKIISSQKYSSQLSYKGYCKYHVTTSMEPQFDNTIIVSHCVPNLCCT